MIIATFICCSRRTLSAVLEDVALKIFAGGKPLDPHISPAPLLRYSCFKWSSIFRGVGALFYNSGVIFSEAMGVHLSVIGLHDLTGTISPYPLLFHYQCNMLRCTNEPDSVFRGRHFLRHKGAP